MKTHVVMYLLAAVAVVLIIPIYLRLVNGPAFKQTQCQVVIREPGRRFLGPPQPVADQARVDIVFALLSQAAYQRNPGAKKARANCLLDADATLHSMGWLQWKNFPDSSIEKKFDDVHLRVEVWSNASNKAVAVAFGGTVFSNIEDWRSNLRWFLPIRDDEYTMVVNTFGGAFVQEYLKREQEPGGEFLPHAVIYATGHSLGGGLAQEFAYSLPVDFNVPRVRKVYAFDPTPVTGFFSVPKNLRDTNKESLAIDRIYERGEVLAILRSFTNFVHPPPAREPVVRQIRYNLFHTWNVIIGHSIPELACTLYQASRQ